MSKGPAQTGCFLECSIWKILSLCRFWKLSVLCVRHCATLQDIMLCCNTLHYVINDTGRMMLCTCRQAYTIVLVSLIVLLHSDNYVTCIVCLFPGQENTKKLSTFFGVVIPCTLSMFSIILFLRVGYLVGQVFSFIFCFPWKLN